MSQQASFAPIAALMFTAGIGIPIMATFKSGLGVQLGSPVVANAVSFALGFAVLAVMLMLVGLPDRAAFTFDRPYLYTGVLFVVFYALSITWAAPRIGIGNAVFFVLLGQMVAATTIDHFGLWGAMKSTITMQRAAGLCIMAIGVYLARKPV